MLILKNKLRATYTCEVHGDIIVIIDHGES